MPAQELKQQEVMTVLMELVVHSSHQQMTLNCISTES